MTATTEPVWKYEPNLHADLLAADINHTRMKPDENGNSGGWIRTDVCPFEIMIGTGQSNMNGSYSDADTPTEPPTDTPTDDRCLAWNGGRNGQTATRSGTEAIRAEIGTYPFLKNNIVLQAGRIIAAEKDCAVVTFNISRGNTAIESWLDGNPDVDMYETITAERDKFFIWAGIDPFPFSSFVFIQGGSNEDNKSLTLNIRDTNQDPINSWCSSVLEFYNRLRDDDLIDLSTRFVLGEGSFGSIDAFNSGISMLVASGKIPNLYTIDNRFEPTKLPDDDKHFTSASLTRIGGKLADAVLSTGPRAYTSRIIDQPMTIPLGDFYGDIAKAYQAMSRFDFRDDGGVAFLLSEDITLSKAVKLEGIPRHISERLSIRGELTGPQGAGEVTDFSGTKSVDETTMRGLYQYVIDAGFSRAFDLDNVVLKLENLLVLNDGTDRRDLIDMTNAGLVLHNATLFGAEGVNSSIVDAVDSFIRLREPTSSVCLAYGRGSSRSGGAIGMRDCNVALPGAHICQIELKGVHGSGKSWLDLSDANFSQIAQSAIVLDDFCRAIIRGATFSNVNANIVVNDKAEFLA